jgi:hypothetical protein
MDKLIKIGDKNVLLNNNIGWALIYRDQFGQDIIPTLMPLLAAGMDVVSGIIAETGKTTDIDAEDLLKVLDGDTLTNAMIHMSGLEFADLLKITWSMAKSAKGDIYPIEVWIRDFETFPVEEVIPEVFRLMTSGMISSKNLERLKDLKARLQPVLDSIRSSLQESKED